ncbi:MAG: cation-transporting P-type ATPase [Candidatus ainarchaeum sp.]|nr:cation-transporting P-type ATPase [Candidatus ainarchaeum sp.]
MASVEAEKGGLSSEEAEKRLKEFGPNRVAKPRELSVLGIFREEVTEPMILLLLVVGVVYALWGTLDDALTIFVVIALLVAVEVWNEYRAKKAIASLAVLAAPMTKVVRDGRIVEVETEKTVPGDILALVTGTRIAADAVLVSSFGLQADESALTGESLPVEKRPGEEVFAGTLVVSGEGKARATATGAGMRFGRIAALAREIRPPRTPLQLAMRSLAGTLVFVALFFSVAIPAAGYLRGNETDVRQLVLTGLALAFAVIPEELPIIITMVLAIGSRTLSLDKFLVKKLKAGEVLGDATVILTDKTGTITEGRMKIASVFPKNSEAAVLSAAISSATELSLTPTDRTIMDAAAARSIPADGAIFRERGFDGGRKTRAILRSYRDGFELFVSGAPEEVLRAARGGSGKIAEEVASEAGKGRRVIAFARKRLSRGEERKPFKELEQGLDFVGFIALEDSPRQGVKETIALARRAGIRVVMVTGDHARTALSIAAQVGIDSRKAIEGSEIDAMSDGELRKAVKEASVFARATPEHKYRLVNALHENGEVVAVTGDGVNDALALKGADIGIAMGIKGTDAAKEAADAVLADDNFVTIGRAVFEGRKIFDNLRKGVKYYLSVKAALILAFVLPVAAGLPFPFAPIQIIVLELFMDLAASAGFVAEPAEKNIFERKPRDSRKPFLDSGMLLGIAVSGLCLFAAVMAAYFYAFSLGLDETGARTYAFLAWMIGHILLAYVSRSEREPLYKLGLLSNRLMNLWALAVMAFIALIYLAEPVRAGLKLMTLQPSPAVAATALGFALVAIGWQELAKTAAYLWRPKGPELVG